MCTQNILELTNAKVHACRTLTRKAEPTWLLFYIGATQSYRLELLPDGLSLIPRLFIGLGMRLDSVCVCA